MRRSVVKHAVTLLFATAVVGVGVWTAGSLYVMRDVDSPAYEVLSNTAEYEIRRYPALLIAQTRTETKPTGEKSADSLFRVLAGFIFGDNAQEQNIAMTAPVFMSATSDTSTPMMQFIMPAHYTANTLPNPLDDRIAIRTLPARVVAVRQFGWFASQEIRRAQLAALLKSLQRDGITPTGEPVYAGYQPPFSVPFMKRHEMMVTVDRPAS